MSERAEVKRDGAKAQKNSGRGDYQKGDAQWNQSLVDYKEASKSCGLAAVVASIVPRAPFSNRRQPTIVSSASKLFKRFVVVAHTEFMGPINQFKAST